MIHLDCLGSGPNIRHGFLTRQGGISQGVYASLNCGPGSGDDPKHVAQNRVRALSLAGLPELSLVTAYQIHSAEVAVVDEVWPHEYRPRIDAMVTRRKGVSLGILTADCAPVLLADSQAGVIGAAHAGWRGALAGVLEAAVKSMRELGANPEDIAAGIGPAIAQESYEVGPEFPLPFLAENETNAKFFVPGREAERSQFDLAGYVAEKLARLGIGRIETAYFDTCAERDRFFSHRRMVREKEADYGRQISVIGMV